MRVLLLSAPLLFGCTLLRDADDIVVGAGRLADAAIEDTRTETSANDYRWAMWKMPSNTPTSYETAEGVVTDKITGLRWDAAASGTATYDEATAACAAKSARLPTRIELISLLAISRGVRPTILATSFPSTTPAEFWTSSTLASGGRYVVHFGDAAVRKALGTESFHYRCVRAP